MEDIMVKGGPELVQKTFVVPPILLQNDMYLAKYASQVFC